MSDAQQAIPVRHGRSVAEDRVESDRGLCHDARVRRWLEVAIEVPRDAVDVLSLWLVERGSPGTIEDAAGDRVRLRAHFEQPLDEPSLAADLRGFVAELDEFFPGCAVAAPSFSQVNEEDWAESWKRGFPPLDVGRSLRIRPPWEPRADSRRVDVAIRPAMAFGTGQHASTLGCLLAIEESFTRDGAASPVLDVGTGSGILAIAAAKLGARRVCAVDVDPAAVEAAAENVRGNGVAEIVQVTLGSLDAVPGRFALIVANLYTGVLCGMLDEFAARSATRGRLVISGFLDADASILERAAVRWRETGRRSIDGWTTLTLSRVD